MSVVLPAFTPLQETLYLTLCGRALDNRRPHPRQERQREESTRRASRSSATG